MQPAFESKKKDQKVKRLKIAEIRADTKPLIQSAKILLKERKRIKRNICMAGELTLLPTSPKSRQVHSIDTDPNPQCSLMHPIHLTFCFLGIKADFCKQH